MAIHRRIAVALFALVVGFASVSRDGCAGSGTEGAAEHDQGSSPSAGAASLLFGVRQSGFPHRGEQSDFDGAGRAADAEVGC